MTLFCCEISLTSTQHQTMPKPGEILYFSIHSDRLWLGQQRILTTILPRIHILTVDMVVVVISCELKITSTDHLHFRFDMETNNGRIFIEIHHSSSSLLKAPKWWYKFLRNCIYANPSNYSFSPCSPPNLI